MELAGQASSSPRVIRERAQDLEVEGEPPGVGVEPAELAAVAARRRVLLAEEAVAGELDLELDALAAGRPLDEDGIPMVRCSGPATGTPPSHSVASLARIPDEVDAAAAPAGRHRRRAAEPMRRPERPEALAELGRPVVERLRVLASDPVDGARDEELVGPPRLGIDERPQPLRRLPQPSAVYSGWRIKEERLLRCAHRRRVARSVQCRMSA